MTRLFFGGLTMAFEHYASGTRWEPIVGYSRAIKAGNAVFVSGTTPTDSAGKILAAGDVYRQTVITIQNIEKALGNFGLDLSAVYRTRMYVVNIDDWEKVGEAHGQFFRDIRPATTMVEVSRLISPDILVEIEAEAYAG